MHRHILLEEHHMSIDQINPLQAEILELFADLDAEPIRRTIFDYGKLYESSSSYVEAVPSTVDVFQEIVVRAKTYNVPLRVRGGGNTFNGASLPQSGELLIRTDHLDHFEFETPDTVTVGAGAIVWDVRDLVRDKGFDLPVWNGGWAAPTVGGYINAGGFGKSGLSEVYGGLWENVLSVTVVDGHGQLRKITSDNSDFQWLFGSYGQLGLLVEAELSLVHQSNGKPAYPLTASGRVPKRQAEDPRVNDLPSKGNNESRLFWFSLLISPDDQARAWRDLFRLVRKYQDVILPDGGWSGPLWQGENIGYHYEIGFHRFNPPLVYPEQETFLVIGVMSFLQTGNSRDNERTINVERDFIDMALNRGYRLYLQAENIGRNVNYETYYGPEIYAGFRTIKHNYDPEGLFNRGVVFPIDGKI